MLNPPIYEPRHIIPTAEQRDEAPTMTTTQSLRPYEFPRVIAEISGFNWADLTQEQSIHAAWAYYFFSIQFRENLQIACALFPDDANLSHLAREECDTNNLSPWEGVARRDEKMDHDEFMRRLLLLSPIADDRRREFEIAGRHYLDGVRSMDATTRALSIASYEDGGLEKVFRAMLRMPDYDNIALKAFRHFLSEHIRFDSDPDEGHGALSRHLRPDDRILPLWTAFARLLVDFVPTLESMADLCLDQHMAKQLSGSPVQVFEQQAAGNSRMGVTAAPDLS
jgi:hypothetical protein